MTTAMNRCAVEGRRWRRRTLRCIWSTAVAVASIWQVRKRNPWLCRVSTSGQKSEGEELACDGVRRQRRGEKARSEFEGPWGQRGGGGSRTLKFMFRNIVAELVSLALGHGHFHLGSGDRGVDVGNGN
jgi:hypothetical protein